MVRPAQLRALAQQAVQTARTTIQRARVTFAISETYYPYPGKHSDENARREDWLLCLTTANSSWA